jgi:hypothetical protein
MMKRYSNQLKKGILLLSARDTEQLDKKVTSKFAGLNTASHKRCGDVGSTPTLVIATILNYHHNWA